jgi:hypothetical protein
MRTIETSSVRLAGAEFRRIADGRVYQYQIKDGWTVRPNFSTSSARAAGAPLPSGCRGLGRHSGTQRFLVCGRF